MPSRSRRRGRLPRFLGRAEADRLLAAPPEWTPAGRRDRAVMEFAYGAGVRLGELAALDLGDLDRRRLAATVTGKGNRQRRVIYGGALRRRPGRLPGLRPARDPGRRRGKSATARPCG